MSSAGSHQGLESVKGKFSMKVEVKGRKTGIPRFANLFFILLESKIYARTRFDKNWLENTRVNPNVKITISNYSIQLKAVELTEISESEGSRISKAFRRKYSVLDYLVLWFLIRGKIRYVRFDPL